jgi:hypothetical protein
MSRVCLSAGGSDDSENAKAKKTDDGLLTAFTAKEKIRMDTE